MSLYCGTEQQIPDRFLLAPTWPHLSTQHNNVAGTRALESDGDLNPFSAAVELCDAGLLPKASLDLCSGQHVLSSLWTTHKEQQLCLPPYPTPLGLNQIRFTMLILKQQQQQQQTSITFLLSLFLTCQTPSSALPVPCFH